MTLWSADTANPALALRAIARCLDQCDFGDAVFLTDVPLAAPCRVEPIPTLSSRADYSTFLLRHLADFVRTDFVLIVQWDGYVVDPGCWSEDFLAYDYIGARWPWREDATAVGNGGFSLRSRRLMQVMAELTGPGDVVELEDLHICRDLRPRLESRHGIRFAPNDVADVFSYEFIDPLRPSLGFHGLGNLWRHIDDREMKQVASLFSADIVRSEGYARLLVNYGLLRKFDVLRDLYRHITRVVGREDVSSHLDRSLNHAGLATNLVTICENASRTRR